MQFKGVAKGRGLQGLFPFKMFAMMTINTPLSLNQYQDS